MSEADSPLRQLPDLPGSLDSKAGSDTGTTVGWGGIDSDRDQSAVTVDREAHPVSQGMIDVAAGDYEILGEVGRGGMGIVYRALDRRRNAVVALKALPRLEPAALYRFKQEFRALVGVVHPNLATLYELVAQGSQWFLVMEFVEGVDFLTHIRFDPGGDARDPEAGPGSLTPEQVGRLRGALRQLGEGVQALHEAGKLHRDLKPSNVLVSRSGRVVILDFGLVAEQDRAGQHESIEGGVVGTVAYMAPEQAASLPVCPASDWYSVGVMLYEALTGQRPFAGNSWQILNDKQEREARPPRERATDVPEDLNALCVALLNRKPELRPPGRDILRQLNRGDTSLETLTSLAATATASEAPFIGRDGHLQALMDAYQQVRGGRTVVVSVQGRSGVGKSVLVQRFLEEIPSGDEAVILVGRCYEHEAMPYKAVDSVVDALSRYLRRVPDREAEALLPRDVLQLARLFPVLRTVGAVARAPGRLFEIPDPQELRRLAFAALRELLARLGDRRHLILAIDDLQWGDTDSAALLAELLRPPDSPVLLLVGSYRSEEVHTSRFLTSFRSLFASSGQLLDRRELLVEPLTSEETRNLALRLLGRADPEAQSQADVVVAESGGNPFFVFELVHSLDVGGEVQLPSRTVLPLSLDQVLWERIQQLPQEARGLLEVTALHGRPLRMQDVRTAALVQADERPALALLCSARLLRGTGLTEHDLIEAYHDRVRETVVAHLEPARRSLLHGSLARTLESAGQAEPEILAVHFLGADDTSKAGHYYARAADQAASALAFERAAKLYRLALELRSTPEGEDRPLRIGLADALAYAGRGKEAATEYLLAAEKAPTAESVELRRRAAFHFLTSGHVDEGLDALRAVLSAVGMKLAATPGRALLSLLIRRLHLWFRGIGFRERDIKQVSPDELLMIDITWSVSTGLGMIDSIRGSDFQAQNLLLALRAGEPLRVARGLSVEAMYSSITGAKGQRRATQLLDAAETITRRIADPYTIAMILMGRGMAAYLGEDWQQGQSYCDRAEDIFRDRCAGAEIPYTQATGRAFALWSLAQRGEVAELSRRCPPLLQEARRRTDLYALTTLGTKAMALAHLGADDAEAVRREAREVEDRWSHKGYFLQHLHALFGLVPAELYLGQGKAAWDLVEAHSRPFRNSLLPRIKEFRIQMLQARAAAALGAARDSAHPQTLLLEAERTARYLEREKMPSPSASALYVRAAIASLRGDRTRATALLTEAIRAFELANMHLHVAVVRRRLGELLGEDRGRELVALANAWMAGQQIQNPMRMTAAFAPGFPDLLS